MYHIRVVAKNHNAMHHQTLEHAHTDASPRFLQPVDAAERETDDLDSGDDDADPDEEPKL